MFIIYLFRWSILFAEDLCVEEEDMLQLLLHTLHR